MIAPSRRIDELLEIGADDAEAIHDFDGQRYSYRNLRTLVEKATTLFQTKGVRGGDRVVVVSENSIEFAVYFFALCRLNAWAVLVNARQSATEIDAVIAHSDAAMVLFTNRVSAEARAHADRLSAHEIGDFGTGPILGTNRRDTPPEPVVDGPDQVAVLLYTTGTTSAPKGVMLSHGNLSFNGMNSGHWNRLQADDYVMAVLPGTHIYCLGSVFLPAIAAGATTRFMARFVVDDVLEALNDGITRFPAVPQMYAQILERLDATGKGVSRMKLRNLATGGAPLDPDLKRQVEERFGLQLNNGYGITETSPTIASTHNDVPRSDLSCGTPLPGIEVTIRDADADGIGEIYVTGPNVMMGYYRDPERSAEALPKPGTFRTGDLGRIAEDGSLYILGRSKELIIRSGFNIYPPEIEAMLTRHEDVYQAAVIGRQVKGNEEVLAFVKTTGRVTEAALKDWLRERLVGYKIPQHIFLVDEYPAAATGKILKFKLQSHFADLIAARD